MVGDQAVLNTDPSEEESCAHHWLIESPDGETSRGVCRICGSSRRFANYNQRQITSPGRRTATSRAPKE